MITDVFLISIGTAVAKAFVKLFLKDHSFLSDMASDLVGLLGDQIKENESKEDANRQIEIIGQQVASQIIAFLKVEAVHIDQEGKKSVVYEYVKTLEEADLSLNNIFLLNLEFKNVFLYLKENRKDVTKHFSKDEENLYFRLLEETSRAIVQVADKFSGFLPLFAATSLKNEDKLIQAIDALYSLPPKESTEFEKKYLQAINNHLDYLEMFGIRRMDELSSQQKITDIYVDLETYPVESNALLKIRNTELQDFLRKEVELLEQTKPTLQNLDLSFQNKEFLNFRMANAILLESSLKLKYFTELIDHYYPRSISLTITIKNNRRLVLQGEAGSGKTTCLQWLAVRVSLKSFQENLSILNETVPFFIRLRERVNKDFPTPEEFPESVARNITGSMPRGWVHSILENGRALLLIDGVDEIPESKRGEMLQGIKDLITDYPFARFIITTRPHAIKGWKDWDQFVSAEKFHSVSIKPMQSNEINEFINNWHNAFKETSFGQTLDSSAEVMADSLKRILRNRLPLLRLAANPLLCAMVCALHSERQQSLPEERVKLYEECVEMLLDRRDLGRKISTQDYPNMSYYQKLEIIQNFAHWFMRNGYSEASIEEANERLQSFLPESLKSLVTGEAVRRFYSDRCNLLREPAEDRVDFTHRTFQEFLAAQAAIRNDDVGMLVDNSLEDTWRETIVLASAIAGIQFPKNRTKLLRSLLARAPGTKNPENQNRVLLLAVSCLENEVGLDPIVRDEVLMAAKLLFPPKDEESSKMIAKAGDPAVKLLQPKPEYSEEEAAICVKTLGFISSPESLKAIAGYGKDERRKVKIELGAAWNFFDRDEYARTVLSQSRVLVINSGDSLRGIEQLNDLRVLSIASDKISDLHRISHLLKLESLEINAKTSESYDFIGKLVNLKHLNLDGSNVTDLSFLKHLPKLETLSIASTNVRDISPISNLTLLRSVNLRNTSITNIRPVRNLQKLTTLDISETKVSSITPLASCLELTNLYLDRIFIEKFTILEKLTKLHQLSMNNTVISNLTPLSGLSLLESLFLRKTKVNNIYPLRDLVRLETLDLSENSISDLSPVHNLVNLKHLIVRNTNVTEITALGKLVNLEVLDLWGLNIEEITVVCNFSRLKNILLGKTKVKDISCLASLKELNQISALDTDKIDFSPFDQNPRIEIILLHSR